MVDSTRLSDQQIACLQRVERGLSSKEIAHELGISPATVDTYLKAAMQRLGTNRRRDAARILRSLIECDSLPQKLGSPSDDLVQHEVFARMDASLADMDRAEATASSKSPKALRWIAECFGGTPHDLNKFETVRAILWTALAATGVLAAMITIGAWLNYKAP